MNSTAPPPAANMPAAPLSIDGHALDLDGDRDIAFLLRNVRRWLIGLRHSAPDSLDRVWNDFACRFGSDKGKEALAALAGSIKTIQLHARRRLRYHPPCCRYLTPDELGYLHFIAACQAGDKVGSRQRAEWLVTSDGLTTLLESGRRLADLLRDRGVTIRSHTRLHETQHSSAA